MYPQTHLIIGIAFTIILFPFFGFFSLLILLSSILIDTDHYVAYMIHKKSLNLRKAFNWFSTRKWKKEINHPFVFFHFIEVLLIFFILGFRFILFFYIFLGFILHIPFDLIKEIKLNMFRLEKYSFLYYLAKA